MNIKVERRKEKFFNKFKYEKLWFCSKQQSLKTYEKNSYDIYKEVYDHSIFKIEIKLQNNILNYLKTIKIKLK